MADLIVHPSLVLGPDDILTCDKLNLLGTPIVELAVSDSSVNDQNFCRNGNFYSSFWTTPTGISCPVGVRTTNASYWQVLPTGGVSIVTTGTTASTIHITAIPSTVGMLVGMQVTGAGIPAGATIATVVSGTAIDLSAAATTSVVGVALTVGNMVVFLRSNSVPDTDSLFSAEIQGNTGLTNVRFSQDIQGDLAATLRNPCTFSGYLYNSTGVTLSPQLIISSANAFNNFSARTDVSSTNLQSCPAGQWTYVTDTVDLTSLSNIANGFSVVVSFGGIDTTAKYVLFSRLKFQAGQVATPFTDDVSLFVQTPSVDSTMLQDGCIARTGLFLQNVIPLGAYVNQSIQDAKIATGTILPRSLAAGTAVANIGYTPENKAGDTCTGTHIHVNDTVANSNTYFNCALRCDLSTTAFGQNAGYMPAIGFSRPNQTGRCLGLHTDGRFKTIDFTGTVGYLLDTVTGVDTNSYQNASITYAKLAQALINQICPTGMIMMFGGGSPPSGWLLCDGSPVSRTTYSALWGVIGTLWGAGDGASTFNVPNLQGRAPIGYVTNSGTAGAGITARGFGNSAVYGEENHSLNTTEMPAHAHPLSQNPHTHTYTNPAGNYIGFALGGTSLYSPAGTAQTGGATADISMANTGGNGAHNNMMPFAVVYYVIKYL